MASGQLVCDSWLKKQGVAGTGLQILCHLFYFLGSYLWKPLSSQIGQPVVRPLCGKISVRWMMGPVANG